jgi:membrane-associated phospholipid phosphatase
MPADRRETWTPKATGPAPYTRVVSRPAAAQWAPDSAPEQRLIEALYRQQFRNIKVEYDGSHRLSIALTNDHLHPISRAVGRAARTALNLAPLETREIRITYAARTDPLARYDFIDLGLLGRYFAGTASAAELAKSVKVDYLNPAAKENDPLARLDDLEPEAQPKVLAALVPETFSMGRVGSDVAAAAQVAGNANWLQAGAIGAGLVLVSSKLDRRADQFAKDHAASRWVRDGVRVGNALPWLGLAGSALAAFDGSDPRRSQVGFAATEAGFAALLASSGLKYAVGRARPKEELGNRSFNSFTSDARYSAFPSRHSSVAWAVATPFALEYDAPWLYGAAFLTNLARVGAREHWVSDTVAGGLIGYGLGRIFWESSRSQNRAIPRVMVYPNGIRLAWVTD